MERFKGFSSHPGQLVPLPDEFFSKVLPGITDLFTLKVILFAFRQIALSEDQFPFLTHTALMRDPDLLKMMGESSEDQQTNLQLALNNACEAGVILKAPITTENRNEILYFLNSPRGQKALDAIQNGNFNYNPDIGSTIQLTPAQPNIFRLYEENIGPLTPIIADTLTELENEYSAEWIAEAFREALKNNVRNLRYIEAILKNWQEAGKHDRTNRRSSQKNSEEHDPDQYIGGEFSEFIDH